jgi:hypothetical protein
MQDIYCYFKNNKYTRWYFSIIQSAQSRANSRKLAKSILGYVESHHIVPKSVAPELSNVKDNIAHITAREHFICHLLLTKCIVDEHQHKMNFAFMMMFSTNQNQNNRYINSKFYTTAKLLNSESSINRNKKRKYKIGYNKPLSEETKRKIGLANKGKICVVNTSSQKTMFLDEGDDIPLGYSKGASPKLVEGSVKAIKGSRYIYNPQTGEELRFKGDVLPEGFVIGRSMMFITNGVTTKTINKSEDIPTGWVAGRSLKPTKQVRRDNKNSPIETPFGKYNHILTFCEEFNIDPSYFENLKVKMRNRKSTEKLRLALETIGVNTSLTKEEMGFRILNPS